MIPSRTGFENRQAESSDSPPFNPGQARASGNSGAVQYGPEAVGWRHGGGVSSGLIRLDPAIDIIDYSIKNS